MIRTSYRYSVLERMCYNLRIHLLFRRVWTHAKDSILALEPYPHTRLQKLYNAQSGLDRC